VGHALRQASPRNPVTANETPISDTCHRSVASFIFIQSILEKLVYSFSRLLTAFIVNSSPFLVLQRLPQHPPDLDNVPSSPNESVFTRKIMHLPNRYPKIPQDAISRHIVKEAVKTRAISVYRLDVEKSMRALTNLGEQTPANTSSRSDRNATCWVRR
jgi:hypothetical protein